MKAFLGAVSLVAFLAWCGVRIAMGISFDIDLENYVSQAASSPSPQIASQKLGMAIDAAQRRGLTQGNTGIFFTYPTNDVGFWYQRLVDSRAILSHLAPNDTPLEVSNTMMRVHESLTASGSKGAQETVSPDGISIYPHNVPFFWWGLLSALFACLFIGWAIVDLDI